jgi:lysozyme
MAQGDPLDPQYADAIKGFEGYSPNASWDYKQSSSGYGTKAQPGDENIPPDQLKAIHEQRFQDEVGKAAASVDAFNPNLPPGVKAALTSLTYNAGPSWQQSGLGAALNSGDLDKAKSIFLQYNKAGGQVNPGLVNRRQQEAAWFGGGLPSPHQAAPVSPASPANAIPQQAAPIMPQGAPQAAPMMPQAMPQAPQAAPPAFAQIPQAPLPQINFAQRKPIDLSVLKSYLARNQA